MTNHLEWAARGYGAAVLPVIPPDAVLSANSSVPPDQRGKLPGMEGQLGWFSFSWRGHEASQADLTRWARMNAGVGLQSRLWPGLDIDVLDARVSDMVAALARKVLGPAVRRIGRAPKQLLPYRLAPGAEPFGKRRYAFRLNGVDMAVEMLADKQFYVVAGVHPGTGKPYAWPDGEPAAADLSPVTGELVDAFFDQLEQALDMVGAEPVKRSRETAGAHALVDQAHLVAPSAAVLEDAMPHVPNTGGYDDWIPGLCAIKAAAAGVVDDGGRELARAWTDRWAGGGQGAHIDFDGKWEQLAPPFSVGWGWLEATARATGWTGAAAVDFAAVQAVPSADAGGDRAAIAARADARLRETAGQDGRGLTIQEAMFADWVWIEGVKRFGELSSGDMLDKQQFDVRMAHIGPPHKAAECASAVFLADYKRRRMVKQVTFLPGAARLVEEAGIGRCFNRWRPSKLVPKVGAPDADIVFWLERMEALFPDQRIRDITLDWMAFLLQRQDRKPNWAPVLVSLPGSGKDFIMQPLIRALGEHNVTTIGVHDVESGFNDWSASARLVVFNEAHSVSRVALADKMKPHNCAPPNSFLRNAKNVTPWQQPNRHAMLYFSNRYDAVQIEDGDRRYFVVHITAPAMPDDWWTSRWERLDAGGAEAVAGWLLARDIGAFNPFGRAPWTPERDDMARDTQSDLRSALADEIEGGGWPDLVYPADIAARLNAAAGARGRGWTGRSVMIALKQAGCRPVHGGQLVCLAAPSFTGSERVRLLSIRNHDSYVGLPPAALAREFTKGWCAYDGKVFQEVVAIRPLAGAQLL